MCTPVVQGYGLSETCGSSFVALPAPVRARVRGLTTQHFNAAFRSSVRLCRRWVLLC